MTEEEAKTKWCPMVRVVYGIGDNRGLFESTTTCIASDCMMWRNNTIDVMVTTPEDAEIAREHLEGGYCGLSGKPW